MAARKKSSARKKATSRSRSGARKTKKAGRRKKAARKASRRASPRRRKPRSLGERLSELVEHAAVGVLRRAVDAGGPRLGALLPQTEELRREAGASIRELRELAGLTRTELAEALDLSDQSLLAAVEAGTATLSFDLTLRLAAILARHDPVPFVSRLVRGYNPVLWELLEDWGIEKLPLQLERERQFVNILRGADASRALDDADFAQVLAFTRAAFETALHFASK